MSALALAPPGPGSRQDAREAGLWGIAFAAALATHVALGVFLLVRTAERPTAAEDLPAVQVDMAPLASAPVDTPVAAQPQPSIAASAAPDPVFEEVPEVPDAVVPPAETLAREPVTEPPVATAAAQPALDLPLPEPPPPAVVPPNPAVVLPRPAPPVQAQQPLDLRSPKPPPTARPVQKPPERKVVERKPIRQARAETVGERRIERRPASDAAGIRTNATTAGASSAASAAASAAWRSQLVAYLQSRLRYPGGSASTGAAGVAFSVSRGGQILGASLVRSSGNPTLDAAALAVFHGGVPPPPPGYSGSLSFNIPIRFSQR